MLTIVLCLGSVVNPKVANTAVYYVATTGNDANLGGQSQPFQSIGKGVSVLKSGDILYLRQGTYIERITPETMTLPSATSWSSAITIAGYPGEVVTLSSGINIQDNRDSSIVAYLIFDNLILRNDGNPAFRVAGNSHHIRLSNSNLQTYGASGSTNIVMVANTTSYNEFINCSVHDAPVSFDNGATTGHYGFYIGGHHNIYDGNRVYNNTGHAFCLYQSGQNNVHDNIIRNNIIYGNGFDDGQRGQSLAAVVLASGSSNQFYNNIVYGNRSSGVGVAYTGGGIDNQVYNNTIYGNSGFGIEVSPSSPNTIIKNNIIFSNGRGTLNEQIVDWGAAGLVQSNNLTTDPKFVNASALDFSLQAGSPAIDAGVTVSVVTTDMQGVARPQGGAYDIGAYEYYKGTTPLPAPSNLRLIAVSP